MGIKKIKSINGKAVMVDSWIGNESKVNQRTLEEQYQKDPQQVHNRLLYEGLLDELSELHEKFGKPKNVQKFEELEKSDNSSNKLLIDLKNIRDTFEALSDIAMEESRKVNLIIQSMEGGK